MTVGPPSRCYGAAKGLIVDGAGGKWAKSRPERARNILPPAGGILRRDSVTRACLQGDSAFLGVYRSVYKGRKCVRLVEGIRVDPPSSDFGATSG